MGRKILEIILRLFWIFPIKNNRLVFRSAQGESYNCNPKYICEYISTYLPGRFELVWVFKSPDRYDYLRNRGIKVCKEKSLVGLYYMITAKFLIDNHGVQSYLPIRKEQEIMNTWHGGGSYKKSYVNATKQHMEYVQKMNKNTTVFLSSCERFSKMNLKSIYELYPQKILESGMPRNDLFFTPDTNLKELVKDRLNISSKKKLVLYAPTFRDYQVENIYINEFQKVISALNHRFGGEFVFAIRFHRFADQCKMESDNVINVNQYDDMQELIYTSDVIISDYSSCIWDASLAYKPCFLYAVDIDRYLSDRNFYTPISEWPFPVARNIDELVEEINAYNEHCYRTNVQKHHLDLGSYESGAASARVAEYIISQCKLQE